MVYKHSKLGTEPHESYNAEGVLVDLCIADIKRFYGIDQATPPIYVSSRSLFMQYLLNTYHQNTIKTANRQIFEGWDKDLMTALGIRY